MLNTPTLELLCLIMRVIASTYSQPLLYYVKECNICQVSEQMTTHLFSYDNPMFFLSPFLSLFLHDSPKSHFVLLSFASFSIQPSLFLFFIPYPRFFLPRPLSHWPLTSSSLTFSSSLSELSPSPPPPPSRLRCQDAQTSTAEVLQCARSLSAGETLRQHMP